MRNTFILFTLFIFFTTNVSSQSITREQKIQELQILSGKAVSLRGELNRTETRQADLEADILSVSDADKTAAENINASAFRIFPRGLLDDKISIRGGAAYYSFTFERHDYNETPQIELQSNNLSVGFAGANFGFISDLGEIPLSKISEQSKSVNFLLNYRPPTIESEARGEYRKVGLGFNIDEVNFKKQVSAIVGHTYILRAINFDEADILVAFTIYRKDSDGSLIIFWKTIKTFETPRLENNRADVESIQSVEITDGATMARVQNALAQKGFYNVTVSATTRGVTLRGTVAKGKLAEAVQTAAESAKKPVKNELTEQ